MEVLVPQVENSGRSEPAEFGTPWNPGDQVEQAAVCGSAVLRREAWAGDVNLRVIRTGRLINAMGVEDLLIERWEREKGKGPGHSPRNANREIRWKTSQQSRLRKKKTSRLSYQESHGKRVLRVDLGWRLRNLCGKIMDNRKGSQQ